MIIEEQQKNLTPKFQKVSKQVINKVRNIRFEPENKSDVIAAKVAVKALVREYLNVVNITSFVHINLSAQGIEPMTDHGFLAYGLYSEKVPLNLGAYLKLKDLEKGSHKLLERKIKHIEMFSSIALQALNWLPVFCDMIERNDPYLHGIYEYYTKCYASPCASTEQKVFAEKNLEINYYSGFVAMRCINWSKILKGTRSISNILKGLHKLKGEVSDVNKAAVNQMRQFHADNYEQFKKQLELAATF